MRGGGRRAAGVLLAALTAALLIPAIPALPALAAEEAGCPPGIGVGLLQFPTDRAGDPRARSYVIDHVAPGASFSRRMQACNGTTAPVTVSLYAAAASLASGQFVPADGRTPNELSGWVRVDPPTMTVPAGQAKAFTATFAVPDDATEGERYAVVQVEGPPSGDGPVAAVARAGIRVYLSVGADGEPQSDFAIESLAAGRDAAGVPVVTARVRNTGARALDLRGSLRLTEGPGGLSTGDVPATLGTTLAVGATEPVLVVLDRAVAGGPWLATLTMRSGTLERRARARLSFPDGAATVAPPVVAEELPLAQDRDVVIPVAAALIGLLALLLLVAALLTSRRRRAAEVDRGVTDLAGSRQDERVGARLR